MVADENQVDADEDADENQIRSGETATDFALYLSVFNLSMWVREDHALPYDDCTAYLNHPAVKSFPKATKSVMPIGTDMY